MTRETAAALIKKSLSFADGEPVSFTFQGGEQLLQELIITEILLQT